MCARKLIRAWHAASFLRALRISYLLCAQGFLLASASVGVSAWLARSPLLRQNNVSVSNETLCGAIHKERTKKSLFSTSPSPIHISSILLDPPKNGRPHPTDPSPSKKCYSEEKYLQTDGRKSAKLRYALQRRRFFPQQSCFSLVRHRLPQSV